MPPQPNPGPRPTPPAPLATVMLFVAIITLPGLGLALGLDRATISESEMRELTPWPAWSWAPARLTAWPADFQKYFDDHFLLRNHLIDWRASLLWKGLRTSPSDTVIAGKDGWLFYAADGGIDDWTQTKPFTPEELESWRQWLVRRRDFLAHRGIRHLFVIAPDKQMIYPEYMPESLQRLRQDFRTDQLIAYLHQTTSDFRILDLRPALTAAKDGELLYHRYDSHWNDRGALIAYQVIVTALQQWFPELRPLARSDFDTSPDVSSGDRITMLGLTDSGKLQMPGLVLRRGQGFKVVAPDHPDPYGEVGLLITDHVDQSLPKAIVYRDSFGGRLIPYLSENFRQASYLWQNEFDFEAIEREKPDVVIQEFVARHFYTHVTYPETVPD